MSRQKDKSYLYLHALLTFVTVDLHLLVGNYSADIVPRYRIRCVTFAYGTAYMGISKAS